MGNLMIKNFYEVTRNFSHIIAKEQKLLEMSFSYAIRFRKMAKFYYADVVYMYSKYNKKYANVHERNWQKSNYKFLSVFDMN